MRIYVKKKRVYSIRYAYKYIEGRVLTEYENAYTRTHNTHTHTPTHPVYVLYIICTYKYYDGI